MGPAHRTDADPASLTTRPAPRLGDLLSPAVGRTLPPGRTTVPGAPHVVRPPDVGGRAAWSVLVRDGALEVVREDAAVPAGSPTTPRLRAALLRGQVPPAATVAGRTAAWVHVGPPAPDGGHLDLAYRARGHRPAVWGRGLVWQAPLLRADVVELGGVRVTAPVRTAVDVALHVRDHDDALRRVLALVRAGGVDLDEADRQLERRVRAVGRPRARDVLGAARSALA